MTSLLRRKRRTTAPRTRPGRTAFKLAVLATLFGGAADAQQQPQPGRAAAAVQPNGLYAPPGYRPRTPPPQPVPTAERSMGGGGRVMYFTKPADALMPSDLPAEGVAMAAAADPVPPVGLPDVPVIAPGPGLLPTPRPLPTIPTAAAPVLPTPTARPVYTTKPLPTETAFPVPQFPGSKEPKLDSQPQQKLDPKVTEVPSREKIFGPLYNDPKLAKMIAKSIRDENVQREEEKRKKGDPKDPPREVAPPDDPVWNFPDPARVAPEGTTYQAKTATYAPRVARTEPTYVVHRRLHFEEKNAERYGWDLGFVQPLASTLYFYRDTLLWPQSLVSGLVHGTWDTSAGKCLPGSPVPYYLYPPGLTITGSLAEAGLITGLSIIIP